MYVTQVQAQLAAAAALGDESTRTVAAALAAAAEPAIRLAVLSAVSAAADEITAALLDTAAAPSVSVHLDGEDIRVSVRARDSHEMQAEGEPTATSDADATARITLRLTDALKNQVEDAARREAVSVNTWLVRAATAAVSRTGGQGRRAGRSDAGTFHVTGWVTG